MILSDKSIEQAISDNQIEIAPYEAKQLQPASYDLRVGKQGATVSGKKIEDISEKGFIAVAPGDSALISTYEIIAMDTKHAARFGLTSGHARKGVYATTGTQIDPGFKGRLFVGITNLTPKTVTFTYQEDFLTLEIHELLQPCKNPYAGPYQNKKSFDGRDVEYLFSSEGFAFSDMTKSIQSLSVNVEVLAKQMTMLLWGVPIVATVSVALVSLLD